MSAPSADELFAKVAEIKAAEPDNRNFRQPHYCCVRCRSFRVFIIIIISVAQVH